MPDDRPSDEEYYVERRTVELSQGDVLAFGVRPIAARIESEASEAADDNPPLLVSASLRPAALSMVISPRVSIRWRDQNTRLLAPIISVERFASDGQRWGEIDTARNSDSLLHHMYLPPSEAFEITEGLVALHQAITVYRDLLEDAEGRPLPDLRRAQLAEPAARQLQRKLVWYVTGGLKLPPEQFQPPLD